MAADLSFEVVVAADRMADALAALAEACTAESAAELRRIVADAPYALVLELATDPALEPWRASHPEMQRGAAPGAVRVGNLQLALLLEEDRLRLELWPLTTAMGKACAGSPSFRAALARVVERAGGGTVLLDRGDGRLEEI